MKQLVHAVCPHDCPDACGVVITVEQAADSADEFRATKIQGDPAHPVTRGFLCAKVAKYLDRVYSPDRLLYPLKRIAPKGRRPWSRLAQIQDGERAGDPSGPDGPIARWTDSFVRISWDEALDEIATRFKAIASEYGPEAILPYSYGGTLGALNGASMDRRFFHRLGASQLERTICSSAGEEGLRSVIGHKYGTEPEQFALSRTIIAWGANIHGNNIHLWPFIEAARRQGARLIVIDPYRTRTAACADWFIPINPGTDVALALGMMHVIIGEKLYDEDYVAKYTRGFDLLCARAREYAPERVSSWTGVAAEDIYRLAREYATATPAVIRVNYGLQRCDNGGMAMRAVTMLPCLTGSWKQVGGGLQLSTSGAFGLDKTVLARPDLMMKSALGRSARVINMVELGRMLTAGMDSELVWEGDGSGRRPFSAPTERVALDPPVKALFVYNSNPAAVAPDHNNVVRGLLRNDLFTVVHEQFLTDTCDYADMVLPATTFLEHKDLQASYGHYYVGISQPAIAPLGECKSNVELFRELALRMGFEEACFCESVDEMIDTALGSGHEHLQGVTRERLERQPFMRLSLGRGRSLSTQACARTDLGAGNPQVSLANVGHPASSPQGGFFLPFAEGGFGTPSGKAEFYSDKLAAMGLDPIVSFTPVVESRHTRISGKYPLELLARKADNYVNSTFANLQTHQRFETISDGGNAPASPLLTTDILDINSADANSRGIRNGDSVRVFNDRGELCLVARVSGHEQGAAYVQPGVVAARLTWAKLSEGGRNVNALTSDRLTDMGGGATFYSVMVEAERI